MKTKLVSGKMLIVATAMLALTTAALPEHSIAAEFLPFEGKNTVREGEGGTKKVVDGIDFWANGEPPRKYQLLGFVEDTRHKSGLIGMMSMAGLEGDVAAAAKSAGGDAVILVAAEAETIGAIGNSFGGGRATAYGTGNAMRVNGTGWGMGATAAVQKQHSRYAVVKYLQDAPSPAPVNQSPNAPAPAPAAAE